MRGSKGLAALLCAVTMLAVAAPSWALDDGQALTPPMGYNDWNAFGCNVSEALIKDTALAMHNNGMQAAGYQYVNIDDCWLTKSRDANGHLVPDPVKFPDGIKGTAEYVHSLGLKLGIYNDAGSLTCAGYPGSYGHETTDAQGFADWGVDYLKYDNCNTVAGTASNQQQYIDRYNRMRDALLATGRAIVYSLCEWGNFTPWTWGANTGNLWRTTGDISDSFASMLSILGQNAPLDAYAGPGHWNDPDMLEVGNGGMTDTEYRSHFSLWAVMAAPLLIGTDLRKATQPTFDILENRDIIAVDQDELGAQGALLRSENGGHILVKPLANGDRAVVLFNESEVPLRLSTSTAEIGMARSGGYAVRDLWTHTDRQTAGTIAATLPPHGSAMYRISTDRRWPFLPPAVDFGAAIGAAYAGAPPLTPPGTPAAATTTVTNSGVLPVLHPTVDLTGPAGCTVTRTSPRQRVLLDGHDKALTTTWQVTAPAGTAPGPYNLTAPLTSQPLARGGRVTVPFTVPAVVPPAAPAAGT